VSRRIYEVTGVFLLSPTCSLSFFVVIVFFLLPLSRVLQREDWLLMWSEPKIKIIDRRWHDEVHDDEDRVVIRGVINHPFQPVQILFAYKDNRWDLTCFSASFCLFCATLPRSAEPSTLQVSKAVIPSVQFNRPRHTQGTWFLRDNPFSLSVLNSLRTSGKSKQFSWPQNICTWVNMWVTSSCLACFE